MATLAKTGLTERCMMTLDKVSQFSFELVHVHEDKTTLKGCRKAQAFKVTSSRSKSELFTSQ